MALLGTGCSQPLAYDGGEMDSDPSASPRISLLRSARQWWNDIARREGSLAASRQLLSALWEFVRDSTPERRRQRYGDAEYDWEHRVNTTSAAVGWRDRLLGLFHSPYQPTESALFHEMLDALHQQTHSDFRDFVFLDLGSGKGRTLLMAADYPFRRIVGVELLPALHQAAQDNLSKYRGESQKCFLLESICADATEFPFPAEPTVLYLFNPFPEAGLRRMIANLEQSLLTHPRAVYVLYHNPLLEHVLSESAALSKVGGTHQYSIHGAC
jgi:predicted RNA methylase